jgi:hypothetical protein
MKGISNRQKMIVKPRESAQKYVSQLRNLRKSVTSDRSRSANRKDVKGKRP